MCNMELSAKGSAKKTFSRFAASPVIARSKNEKGPHFCEPSNRGAGTRSRTRDLLITSQLLYQLSYTGI